MKALIVAHPDDEIIWFSPQDFDPKEIYIKNRAWTWKRDYAPPLNLYYSQS